MLNWLQSWHFLSFRLIEVHSSLIVFVDLHWGLFYWLLWNTCKTKQVSIISLETLFKLTLYTYMCQSVGISNTECINTLWNNGICKSVYLHLNGIDLLFDFSACCEFKAKSEFLLKKSKCQILKVMTNLCFSFSLKDFCK